jgi:MATE family multidrug resistance protein
VAIGTAAFTASFWLFSFLAYGVTPRVARAVGGGDRVTASRIGVQATLLAFAIGVLVMLGGLVFAGPIVRGLGAGPDIEPFAESYLRIRALSAGAVLLAQVGHGWLRGVQDTRTPMVIALVGAGANVVLDYLLIYPAGLGVQGAAWATVIGQWGVAIAFLVILHPRFAGVRWRVDFAAARDLLRVGADLVVRTGALLAALTIATSVAARMGTVPLAAWQIAMQVFLLLALSLDSVAIAGQALVGKHLGAAAPEAADRVGRRLMEWGVAVGIVLAAVLFLLRRPIADVFSDDPVVVRTAADLIGWVAIIQPLNGIAFTLDGILIGASDTRFLAVAMVACSTVFVALSIAALQADWGTVGLAAGATVWLVCRSLTTGGRFLRGRWALQP